MPKIIGLTGGIGSGKTRVVQEFMALGVPCYIADIEAKKLMQHQPEVKVAIIQLFGSQAYNQHGLNRNYLSEIVFSSPKKLQQLNAIVHPAVKKDFTDWLMQHNTPYVIKEVAILFETGGNKAVDYSLLITAPKALRIERAMQRDGASKDAILARMQNQWEEDQKIPLADHVLENIDWDKTKDQIHLLHQRFLSLAAH
ncbi:MAG: dephospho-CoA kinase [Flavobacteriaceae bacterium]